MLDCYGCSRKFMLLGFRVNLDVVFVCVGEGAGLIWKRNVLKRRVLENYEESERYMKGKERRMGEDTKGNSISYIVVWWRERDLVFFL